MTYTSLPRELSAAALPAPMTRGSGPAVRQEIPSPTIHTHRGGLTHPASHIL